MGTEGCLVACRKIPQVRKWVCTNAPLSPPQRFFSNNLLVTHNFLDVQCAGSVGKDNCRQSAGRGRGFEVSGAQQRLVAGMDARRSQSTRRADCWITDERVESFEKKYVSWSSQSSAGGWITCRCRGNHGECFKLIEEKNERSNVYVIGWTWQHTLRFLSIMSKKKKTPQTLKWTPLLDIGRTRGRGDDNSYRVFLPTRSSSGY